MVIKAFRLAAWNLDRQAEVASLHQWINREAVERTGGGLGTTLFAEVLYETTDINTLRALKARFDFGDSISLLNVSTLIKEPFLDKESAPATLLVGSLVYDPYVTDAEIKYAVKGLELYGESVNEYLNGESWQENCMLLARATVRIINECGKGDLVERETGANGIYQSFKIASDDLAVLILEHGEDRLQDIIDIISERGTGDASLIGAILDSEAQAISEGEL